jgi:hypothetical protein
MRSAKQTAVVFALLILCASFGVSAYFLMPDHGTIPPEYSLLTRATIGDITVLLPTQSTVAPQQNLLTQVKRLHPIPTPTGNVVAPNHVFWLAPKLRPEIEDTIRETLNTGNVPNVVTRSRDALIESNAPDIFRSEQEARQRANTSLAVSISTADIGDTVELSFAVTLERRVWLEPNAHFPVLVTSSFGSQTMRVSKTDFQHMLFEGIQRIIHDDVVTSYRNSNPDRAKE